MEQRWFIGAHSDVGGGYVDRRLSDITLQWMQQKAAACGLAIDSRKAPYVAKDHYRGPITDSYSAFLKGTLKTLRALTGEDRYYRAVCQTVYGNEAIDRSALLRFLKGPSYQPKNRGFAEHLQSHFPTLMRRDALDEAA
jgi:hypothetical protein